MTLTLGAVLAASLAQTVAPPPAAAVDGGPSVPLPVTPSVAVGQQSMQGRAADDASGKALSGNQGAGADLDGTGLPTATPLSPSASWDVAQHTGDFTWSYPLRVPPAPGGLEPRFALSYSSSSVDGRTSATNNQPSWVGDGWDLSPGFIERAYGGCADDTGGGTTPPKTGDLCWRSDNATAAYGGQGGTLVRDDATGVWRPRGDDGSRVERFENAGNGDDNGERWVITTLDGTRYHFGSSPEAKSTWTVPVFGDDELEPCHKTTFAESHCAQAWRWNLDKVVDRNGNVIRYFYDTETNSYGRNLAATAVPYIRGGTLLRAEYGLREDSTAPATGRVVFTTAERCVPGSECVEAKPNNWPDVPWSSKCAAATCPGKHAPTFWSTRRLASITTEVWRGTGHVPVDRWTLEHLFPDPGDGDVATGEGEKAALWLKSVTHTGLVGAAAALPAVTFEGHAMPNRVDSAADGIAPLNRYRVTGVVSESGGVTAVTYESQCRHGGPMPATAETNTLRCYPVRWAKKNHEERTDHFHKYVVSVVVQTDRIATNPAVETRYEYLDGAAWHWDTSEFTKDDKRTWNEFRGFGRVRVRTGTADTLSGPVTMTETRYHRGMDGDRLSSGTRPATVTDTEGGSRADLDWLRGFAFENATFEREGPSDLPDPPRVAKRISDPVWEGPTATRGTIKSYRVRTGSTRQYTALASGGWRQTRTDTRYDTRGLPDRVDDLGDVATADDDLCTTTAYVPDHLVANLPATVKTVSVRCGEPAEFPRHAVSANRYTYDAAGNATKTEVASEWTTTEPVYATTGTAVHDVHGRATSTTDARGHTSTLVHTPLTGGPVTKTVATSPPTAAVPAGLVTTTTLEPAWGVATHVSDPNRRRTEVEYDPLGRKVAVWLPNRPKSEHPTRASVRMAYLIRDDATSAVTTTRIGANGTDIVSTAIFDGLLRPRQTQSPAAGGGRLITDTQYDSHGRAWKSTQPYFNDSPVDTALLSASDEKVAAHSRTLYDGAGRPTAALFFGGAHEKWRTTTTFGGDWVRVEPPAGGTITTRFGDARGRTVELREHSAPDAFDVTRYTYTPAGKLASVTDPSGNAWRFEYDLRGRATSATDPDTGVTTTAYDNGDLPTSVRDASGRTVATAYDALGRPTGTFADQVGGPKLTSWAYDTAGWGKGQPASATRWVGAAAYTTSVVGYTPLYLPTGESVTIPAEQGQLENTYTTHTSYDPDGSVSGVSYPAAGELPDETVNHDYTDLGHPTTTSGGYEGTTVRYASATDHTRYGEQQRVQLGSGTKRAWLSSYYDDHTRRLKRSIVDAEIPSPMVADNHYTYDPAGNVTSIADTTLDQTADVQCFRNDHLRRTTQAWTPAASTWSAGTGCQENPTVAGLAGPAPYWHSYTYDKSGNRLTETRHAAAGAVTKDFAYDVPGHAHALNSVTTTAANGTSTVEDYEYDAAGRTLNRGGQTLTWNAEGRLGSVARAGETTSFIYDANGNRLLRKDPTGTTLYLAGQEVRVGTTGGPTVTRYYSHGGRVIAMRQGRGALTWLGNDRQGTARVAVDADTREVTRRRQLPFGGPRGAAPAWPGDRGFLGATADASTGLTHLGAREYDPDLGRFISVDPILDLSTPQQLNGYAYSDNNPATFSDPSGLIKDSCPDGECRFGDYPDGDGPADTYNPPVDWSEPAGGNAWTPPKQKAFTGPVPKGAPRPVQSCFLGECRILKDWQVTPKPCEWNGSGFSPEANISCIAARGEQRDKRIAATPPPTKPKRELSDLQKWALATQAAINALRSVPDGWTVAACGGASVYAGAGAGIEGCIAEDSRGIGWSGGGKAGIAPEAELSAGVGFKIAQGSIEDLGGQGDMLSIPLGPVGLDIGRSDSGKWSFGLGVGLKTRGLTAKPQMNVPAGLNHEKAWSGYFGDPPPK
ncbi:RHS repeat-associated core domain-containing protein [Actinokineospora sp. 24-640]